MLNQIWQHFIDTDFYKLTMGQFIWYHYRGTQIKSGFKCRTKIKLTNLIPENTLRAQLDAARTVVITDREITYLRSLRRSNGQPLFSDEYLEFLRTVRLGKYELEYKGDYIILTFSGPWEVALFWEIPALAVANELAGDTLEEIADNNAELHRDKKTGAYSKDFPLVGDEVGNQRLTAKIRKLIKNNFVKIVEFGTRRRRSRRWQRHVLERLVRELPSDQLIGTSNVWLAMELGLKPIGTMAHELFMVVAAINSLTDAGIKLSQQTVLAQWEAFYGPDLLVHLPDTFGSKAGREAMTPEQVRTWAGSRQDSGNPVTFGEETIDFIEKNGADPTNKQIVFSDGLDVDKMVYLANVFLSRIKVIFGWGTNLTNDIGILALSIVIKVIEASGFKTVKLSDNIEKAQGEREDIERYSRVNDYTNRFSESCTY